MSDGLVSVVILNWNGDKYVYTCVESVLKQSYTNIEIIVVDNGSTDKSLELLKMLHPSLVYVENIRNEGFAVGMNLGLKNAKGDYIMALNMDVCLEKSAIKHFVNEFAENPSVGAMMGKEFLWKANELIDVPTESCGPSFLKKRGQGFFEKKLIDRKIFSFGGMGSFPIFRRCVLDEIFEIVGYYYDPKFETGWEDKDLFFRIHHLGWLFLYSPSSIGYHAGSGSVGEKHRLIDKDLTYQARIFRNRYFFIFKNYPKKLFKAHFLYLLLAELLIPFYYFLYSPRSIIPLVKGQISFFKQLKKIKHDRNLIQSNSKLSGDELKAFFKKF